VIGFEKSLIPEGDLLKAKNRQPAAGLHRLLEKHQFLMRRVLPVGALLGLLYALSVFAGSAPG
jgi:hypothetical protein